MSVIPEVKCRRCGESFSALRSRCPNCGTRRVSQSGRTPGTTPGTVKGTASYDRAETNTKWQMIFGLILVVAVILAVIVMVSTSLNTADGNPSGGKVKVTETLPPTEDVSVVIEQPPTPVPTPTPKVEAIKIFFFTDEKEEFTMKMGEAAVTVTAVAYPIDQFADAKFQWSCSDESSMKITVSEDTKSCTCEILNPKDGGVRLTVTCNGTEKTIPVYLRG